VDIDKLQARHGGARQNRSGDSIRDVVILQIEKNTWAERGYFPYCFRTSGGEKLAADLEHAHKIGNLLCEFQCGG